MSQMSNYLENEILDHILSVGSWTMPANIYLALFTSNPDEDGSGTEVAGNGYAREEIEFDAASGGTTDNTADVEFTASGGNWGTITHWGIYDALTSGNLLVYGPFAASRVINDGDTLTVPAGALDITAA